jgi:SAF domain
MAQTTLPPRQPMVDRGGPMLVPGGGRQRRWSLALLAVLLTVGSALAFVVLWLNAGERKPVIVVAREMQAGQAFTAEDIKVVRISADPGITPLAGSLRDDVIGQTASIDLLPGTLLVADAVGAVQDEDADTEEMTVFRTSSNGSGEQQLASALAEARVMAVDDVEGGNVSVKISVDTEALPEILAAKAADQISLSKR